MGTILLLAFVAVPLIEIGVFIEVGGFLGPWPTIGLVVLTAVIGTWLIRLQGLAVLARAQDALARDELPVAEIFDGLCLLLLPPVRHMAGRWLWRGLKARGGIDIRFAGRRWRGRGEETVIDGEYREVPPDDGPDDADGPPPRSLPDGRGD